MTKIVQPLFETTSNLDIDELCARFENREAVIGVIGMGYVGIPLICAACDKNFKAIGFDIDESKVAKMANPISETFTVIVSKPFVMITFCTPRRISQNWPRPMRF